MRQGKPGVGMMEHDRDGHQPMPDPERNGVHAEDNDLGNPVADRERLLPEVEPEGGGGVHVPVHVVDEVKTPEEGNDVVDPMPDPERVIEQHDGERDPYRQGQVCQVQESETPLGSPPRGWDEKRRLQDRDDGQRDAARRQVARDAARFPLALPA